MAAYARRWDGSEPAEVYGVRLSARLPASPASSMTLWLTTCVTVCTKQQKPRSTTAASGERPYHPAQLTTRALTRQTTHWHSALTNRTKKSPGVIVQGLYSQKRHRIASRLFSIDMRVGRSWQRTAGGHDRDRVKSDSESSDLSDTHSPKENYTFKLRAPGAKSS